MTAIPDVAWLGVAWLGVPGQAHRATRMGGLVKRVGLEEPSSPHTCGVVAAHCDPCGLRGCA